MRFLQVIHRWTGLILLIQLLLWTVSGLYFALVDHHGMAGQQYARSPQPETLSPAQLTEISPSWWRDLDGVTKVHAYAQAGTPRVDVHHAGGVQYLDGRDGSVWRTSRDFAKQLAQISYAGPGNVKQTTPITHSRELHGWSGEGFRFDFDDDLNTRVYVDAASGAVVAHRNTPWVVADWMFRLHFIDYTGGRNFNNLVITVAALTTLWFALSGLMLLIKLISTGDMRFSFRKYSVTAIVAGQARKLVEPAHKTLLQALQSNNIVIASGCGGGGTCGLCQVKMADDTPISHADRVLLPSRQLQEGYRLACQHHVNDVHRIEVPQTDASHVKLQLKSTKFITPMLRELCFKVLDRKLDYAAGQYMLFSIPAGAGRSRPEDIPEHFLSHWQHIENVEYKHNAVQRSYSMATAAGGKELVFTVRYRPQATDAPSPGIGSSFLCNLKPGEIIAAEGPFGDFQRQPGAQRKLCFIGGGAGMAPLRALMQEELNDTASRPITFFYGARNRHELLYYDEFIQHQQRGKLTFIPVLSEPEKTCLSQQDVGFVHEIVAKWLQFQEVDAYDFYLCGPPSMLCATLTMLKEHGVDDTRIRYDDFGS